MQIMFHASSKEEKKDDTEKSVNLTQCYMLWTSRIYIGSESNKGAEEKSAENYWISNTFEFRKSLECLFEAESSSITMQ